MAPRESLEVSGLPLVAVGIDKDKNSQVAFKWALENLVSKGQSIILVHVNTKASPAGYENDPAATFEAMKEVFVPFRCFSTRKEVHCKNVLLEDTDVVKALVDFVSQTAIEKLVLGASSKGGFVRTFRNVADTSTNVSKNVPDFCTVYIINNKGKPSSVRNATRPPPVISRAPVLNQASTRYEAQDQHRAQFSKGEVSYGTKTLQKETEGMRSPFTRAGRIYTPTPYSEMSHSDISFISNDRSSIDEFSQKLSNVSNMLDQSFDSSQSPHISFVGSSNLSMWSETSSSSQSIDDVDSEMRRLKLELKQTMDLYSSACKEALTAKQSAMELHRLKMEEARKLEESRQAENAALAIAEMEKAKCKAAMEAAEAATRMAELEVQKRKNAELKANLEIEERRRAVNSIQQPDLKCRKYTIEEIEAATEFFSPNRKIGEGGYGPVYKSSLDHTPVAIKVLRPDAAQGRSQFQQEVDILSCMRHPNMVLLLGACPDYGCLVYEYMSNGSLEDRLFKLGNTPPIPWQHRFRIAAEIGTALLFLHQAKPEPLVHRDLKPANILLDQNYVSKISDVGLARLVPPSVADNVTQCLMTSAAGTFCYIDPEYQQSGMLGTKSDIYSFGIILLQIVTGKPPMGLTHYVEDAIKRGRFAELLDPAVPDWPVEEALAMAKLAINCAELRRKDRPDLSSVILPELNRLRTFADENLQHFLLPNSCFSSNSQVSTRDLSGPVAFQSGYSSPSAIGKRM